MNIISELKGLTTVEQGLAVLLQSPNALDYSKDELLAEFKEGVSEKKALASYLCGSANSDIAREVMGSRGCVKEFLENVSFNSDKSIPFVVRVIHIALSTQYELDRANELIQASIEE